MIATNRITEAFPDFHQVTADFVAKMPEKTTGNVIDAVNYCFAMLNVSPSEADGLMPEIEANGWGAPRLVAGWLFNEIARRRAVELN